MMDLNILAGKDKTLVYLFKRLLKIAYIKSFKAPEFPVDGNDLIKMGHERGPGIGKTLQALRNQWKAGNFSVSNSRNSPSSKIYERFKFSRNDSCFVKHRQVDHRLAPM